MIESIILFVIVRRYAPHYLFNAQSVNRYGTPHLEVQRSFRTFEPTKDS